MTTMASDDAARSAWNLRSSCSRSRCCTPCSRAVSQATHSPASTHVAVTKNTEFSSPGACGTMASGAQYVTANIGLSTSVVPRRWAMPTHTAMRKWKIAARYGSGAAQLPRLRSVRAGTTVHSDARRGQRCHGSRHVTTPARTPATPTMNITPITSRPESPKDVARAHVNEPPTMKMTPMARPARRRNSPSGSTCDDSGGTGVTAPPIGPAANP